MKQHAFEKFIHKEKGSKKKEVIKQQKRKLKAEARSAKYPARREDPVPGAQNIRSKRTDSSSKPRTSKIHEQSGPEVKSESRIHASMPLNKFIAHAGICSRRQAAELVKAGRVKVNGNVISEPGFKMAPADKVTVNNKPIQPRKNLVYILINKPKDYITTAKDPEGRKTIFELIRNATDERIFPVGRLDRNTTGVLLLTNDGELTQKLTHPSFEVKKIYEVRLDKPVQKNDLEKISAGIQLEDGLIAADAVGYADTKDKSIIGIEIHSGKNRIVRRMFEHLGYNVKNLDRVLFANLTKKNVERGKWRYLNEKEIRLLKYMNQSFVKKKRS